MMKKTIKKIISKTNLRDNYGLQKIDSGITKISSMAGVSPPWKPDESAYWQERSVGDSHGPENYLQEDNSTYVMFDALLPVLDKNASFLEVGCNAGRNLNYLYEKGFRDLAGIDINEVSIHTTMKEHFPELYRTGTFYAGNAANKIKKIPDKRYDVVFSIATLEHITPKDKALFKEMVRVSKQYIAVITAEDSKLYHYNFETIFSKLGCKTVLFRLFYGDDHNFQLPTELYRKKNHAFNSMFLRIFIKNSPK